MCNSLANHTVISSIMCSRYAPNHVSRSKLYPYVWRRSIHTENLYFVHEKKKKTGEKIVDSYSIMQIFFFFYWIHIYTFLWVGTRDVSIRLYILLYICVYIVNFFVINIIRFECSPYLVMFNKPFLLYKSISSIQCNSACKILGSRVLKILKINLFVTHAFMFVLGFVNRV